MTTPTREPEFFVRPADDMEAEPEAFADALANSIIDGLIEMANAERAKKGLPPLEDD